MVFSTVSKWGMVIMAQLIFLIFLLTILIFCGAHLGHIQSLGALLLCFKVVSGLSVNLLKFELVLVGIVPEPMTLASLSGCKVSSLLMMYLGLPLDSSFKSEQI